MATDPKAWMWVEACAVLEQMRRQFFRLGLAGMQAASWEPPIDLFETGDSLHVVVALPRVETQDINVAIEQGILVIAGICHLPPFARRATIQCLEIPYGRFERHVRL